MLWSAVFWKLWWPTMKLCLPWVYLCCVVFVYWGLSKLRGKCHFGFLFLFTYHIYYIIYLDIIIMSSLKIDDFRPIKFLFQPKYERFKSWVRQPYVCHLALFHLVYSTNLLNLSTNLKESTVSQCCLKNRKLVNWKIGIKECFCTFYLPLKS